MTTLYGLPKPIHEAVHVLQQYHYTSLGEVQIKKEAEFAKYPLLLVRPQPLVIFHRYV